MPRSLPTHDQELDLHRRLLAGDETAARDLADFFYEPLVVHLRNSSPQRVTDDQIADAVYETWSTFTKNPGSFDPTTSLWKFLQHIAKCDLLNVVAKEDRRRKHEKPQEAVEHLPDRGIDPKEADRREEAARVRREIVSIVEAGLTDGERGCLELHLAGERKTAPYAEALGLADRAPAEQEAEVKRTKDKLKVRIRRARRNHDEAS